MADKEDLLNNLKINPDDKSDDEPIPIKKIGIFIGTIGFFMVLFLLYSRTFPVIAQAELKTILKSSGDNYKKRKNK